MPENAKASPSAYGVAPGEGLGTGVLAGGEVGGTFMTPLLVEPEPPPHAAKAAETAISATAYTRLFKRYPRLGQTAAESRSSHKRTAEFFAHDTRNHTHRSDVVRT